MFCTLEAPLVAAIPQDSCEWRRSYGRVTKSVYLEASFVKYNKDKVGQPEHNLLKKPVFNIYWTDCAVSMKFSFPISWLTLSTHTEESSACYSLASIMTTCLNSLEGQDSSTKYCIKVSCHFAMQRKSKIDTIDITLSVLQFISFQSQYEGSTIV